MTSARDPSEERVRQGILRKLQADPERYLAAYAARFGNILNADDAAALFDEYNQDPSRYRVAVHPAATWMRDELFRRALLISVDAGKNRVVFTAGSNAAGKSTAISFTKERSRAQVVFDSTFSNSAHAVILVDQVLAVNKSVSILYIRRPLQQALLGMLERARREGRLVTTDQLVNSDEGAARTTQELWTEFHEDPRFEFRFIDNFEAAPRLGTIELADPRDYTEIRRDLYELLDAEHQSGRITEAVYRRIRGGGNSGEPPRR
jgi:hypothetical protein